MPNPSESPPTAQPEPQQEASSSSTELAEEQNSQEKAERADLLRNFQISGDPIQNAKEFMKTAFGDTAGARFRDMDRPEEALRALVGERNHIHPMDENCA